MTFCIVAACVRVAIRPGTQNSASPVVIRDYICVMPELDAETQVRDAVYVKTRDPEREESAPGRFA